MREPWTGRFIAFFAISFIGFSTLYAVSMPWRVVIGTEDNLVENLTVVGFLLAFVAGALRVIRKGPEGRMAVALLAAIGLIGALDELSFGERLLGLAMPEAPLPGPGTGGLKIDGVHDLVDLGWRVVIGLEATHGAVVPLVVTVILAVAGALAWRQRRILAALPPLAVARLGRDAWYLLCVFLALIALAVLIDLHLVEADFYYLYFIEELLELNASAALFLCILAIAAPGSGTTRAHPPDRPAQEAQSPI